jgi:hypothetical protein
MLVKYYSEMVAIATEDSQYTSLMIVYEQVNDVEQSYTYPGRLLRYVKSTVLLFISFAKVSNGLINKTSVK